jgi:uncharacterized Rmd1/YagE family protein
LGEQLSSSQTSAWIGVRALLLGDRIDTTGLERQEVLSTTPLAFRVEGGSFVVLFRYGVVVLFGMAAQQEERNVSAVFDVIEPLARELADHGRTPSGRRTILKHIGNALLVQQRMSGLVAVAEKPDVLWERPDLERFYARLEDEYELKERADLLSRKLTVIANTGQVLADIIDTERSVRLERIIIALILLEVIFTVYQMFVR